MAPVGRSERRHWGSVYVRGLLLDGERKSVEPMARRLPDGNEQAMQQFVGQSPWDWKPVWERLAQRMVRELEPDAVWVIDDTGFPKQGGHSVGVARQYSGTLGKTANCQVAVSLHEVCSEGAAVLKLAAVFAGELDRGRTAAHRSWHSGRCEVSKEVGIGFRDDRSDARLELGGSDCRGRCRVRRCDSLSRRIRKPPPALRRRGAIAHGRMAGTTSATQIKTEADRAASQCAALWKAAASLSQRSCVAGPGMEESSLAGRQQKLAGVSLLGRPRAALPRIS